jgi:hypothetical protein
MVLNGLSLTPLAEALRRSVPDAVQPWYAIGGRVSTIAKAQRLLLRLGPRRGYFPEPDKSILITPIDTPPPQLSPPSMNSIFKERQDIGTLEVLLAVALPRLTGLIHRLQNG